MGSVQWSEQNFFISFPPLFGYSVKEGIKMKKKNSLLLALVLSAVILLPTVSASAAEWESGISAVSVSSVESVLSEQAYQNEVLSLINQQRASHSLKPLTATAAIGSMAAVRAKEASVLFSHTRPDGSTPASLFAQYKVVYSTAGENLAYGYTTPSALVSAWMLSPEHRDNILNPNFQYTGIGVYQSDNGKIYYAQLFYNS